MAINKDEISLDREALKAAAADYHAQGFNCAQSVICAMAPKLGLDDHTAFALAEGFGAGMGLPNISKHSDDLQIQSDSSGTRIEMSFHIAS